MACELKVEAPAGAKPEEAAEGVVGVVDGVQGAADWRVGLKQRAEVDVEDGCGELGMDGAVEEDLEGFGGGGVSVEGFCVPKDGEAAEEDTNLVDVTTTGKGGPVTAVAGNARDTEPGPSGLTVTVSVIVVVELQVVVIPVPGEANPTVVLAAGRLDMA